MSRPDPRKRPRRRTRPSDAAPPAQQAPPPQAPPPQAPQAYPAPPQAYPPPQQHPQPAPSGAPAPRPKQLFSREAAPIHGDLTRIARLFLVVEFVFIGLATLIALGSVWPLVAMGVESGGVLEVGFAILYILAVLVGAAVAALFAYFWYLLLRSAALGLKSLAAIADHTR